jgi:hypothetical protein
VNQNRFSLGTGCSLPNLVIRRHLPLMEFGVGPIVQLHEHVPYPVNKIANNRGNKKANQEIVSYSTSLSLSTQSSVQLIYLKEGIACLCSPDW